MQVSSLYPDHNTELHRDVDHMTVDMYGINMSGSVLWQSMSEGDFSCQLCRKAWQSDGRRRFFVADCQYEISV